MVPTIVGLDLAHTAARRPAGRAGRGRGARHRDVAGGRAGVPPRAGPPSRRAEPGAAAQAHAAPRGGRGAAGEAAPDLARLVHHAAAADDGATVCRYAPLAGREAAAAGSHRQALAHFSAALRHGQRLADAELARLRRRARLGALQRGPVHRGAARRRACGAAAQARCSDGDPPGGDARVRSPRRWCGCRGTASWRATPTAPTPRPRRPSPCSTGRPTALAVGAGRSPRRTSARSARSPAIPAPTCPTRARRTRSCAARGARHRRGPRRPGRALPQLREPRPARPRRRPPGRDAARQPAHRAGARLRRGRGARLHQPRRDAASASHRLDELERCVADGLAFTARARLLLPRLQPRRARRPAGAAARRLGGGGGGAGGPVDAETSPGCPTPPGRTAGCWPAGRRSTRRPAADRRSRGAWEPALRRRTVTELAWRARRSSSGRGSPTAPTGSRTVLARWRPHAARPTAEPVRGRDAALRRPRRAWRSAPFPDGPSRGRRGCAATGGPPPTGWARLGDPYERALELAESGEAGPTVEALHTLEDLGRARRGPARPPAAARRWG